MEWTEPHMNDYTKNIHPHIHDSEKNYGLEMSMKLEEICYEVDILIAH